MDLRLIHIITSWFFTSHICTPHPIQIWVLFVLLDTIIRLCLVLCPTAMYDLALQNFVDLLEVLVSEILLDVVELLQ